MFILVRTDTRQICAAHNANLWSTGVDPFYEVTDVAGDAMTYLWPNNGPQRCLVTTDLAIVPNPAWVDVDDLRDAYVRAKQDIQALASSTGVPAVARQAVVSLGLCVEELLKYLKHRIA